MSNSFIGSKIAIITKSQCRYVGTIIGIDAQTSSILLGSVRCFGTESRPGNFVASQIAGTVVPVMQFANSDIEDLKIVDDESTLDLSVQNQQKQSMPMVASQPPPPPPPTVAPPSIHDDPAIVSAVISSSDSTQRLPPAKKNNDVLHSFHQMNLNEHQTTPLAKPEDFRLDSEATAAKGTWPSVPTKAPIAVAKNPTQGNKSRFFDEFSSTNSSSFQPSTNQSQRIIGRDQDRSQFNGNPNENRTAIGQPFGVNDRSRFPNGHHSNVQQRSTHRNYRPNFASSQNRHSTGRETFQGDVNDFNAEFDFEMSNRKFNKLASEDEFKQQNDSSAIELSWSKPFDSQLTAEHAPIYDKKKSFFDNISATETLDGSKSTRHQHRTTNQDTFGYDSYSQRGKYRSMANNNSYRRGGNANQYRQGNQSNGYFNYHQHQQY